MKIKQRPSEQEVLDLCKAYIQEHGQAPGEAVFQKWARIKKYDYIGIYWARHSDLVIAAGGEPKEFVTKMSDEELFSDYSKVCLHLKKIPSANELKVAERLLKTRTSTIRKNGGKGKADFLAEFSEWLNSSSNENKAILDFPGWETKSKLSSPLNNAVSAVISTAHKIHPFLPAGLLNLPALARNEEVEQQTQLSSFLFEQRCADAFRAIGFEVINIGQGKGRNADSLALARDSRYAVIIDAKAYVDGFNLSASEDRKLKEYAEKHTEEIKRLHGIQNTYLCIVSSSFRQNDIKKFQSALAGTGINGFSLWTANHLINKVEQSIARRFEFSMKDLEKEFFTNSIVD